MSDLKHAKVTRTITKPDGSKQIEYKSYYEELVYSEDRIEKTIITTQEMLLADVIKCLAVITEKVADEVDIKVKHSMGRMVITKTWTTNKQHYNRP